MNKWPEYGKVGRWDTTLAELCAVLPAVLAELRAMDVGLRPFVIVGDPVTDRFVQFARVVKRFPGDDEKGVAQFGELAFDVPALGIYLHGIGDSPAVGTASAVAVLRCWLPYEAKLVVTLDSDALS